jgi:hypothetical protein
MAGRLKPAGGKPPPKPPAKRKPTAKGGRGKRAGNVVELGKSRTGKNTVTRAEAVAQFEEIFELHRELGEVSGAVRKRIGDAYKTTAKKIGLTVKATKHLFKLEKFRRENEAAEKEFDGRDRDGPMLRGDGTNLNTLRKLYGLAFMVETVAGDVKAGFNIPVQEVNNGDWIKHFLGAGNVPRESDARKKAVFRICGIRGWKCEDYDEGDALAILDYAIACGSAEAAIEATPLFAAPIVLSAKEQRRRALQKAAGLATE